MKKIIVKVILWFLIVNIFAFITLNRFNLKSDTAYEWMLYQDIPPAEKSWDIVDLHNRWDTYWYLDIVQNGYYLKTDDTLSNVVFFPLYPLLIKIVGTIFFGNFLLAGWILSTMFLFLSVAYFYKLVKEFHPEIDPELPILFLLIFPTAFFLSVIYTESLFLFLTLSCFYYAFKKEFWLAGFFAFLGAATHSNGIFLALPILWEVWRTYGWKSIFTPKIIPVFFPAIVTGGFFLYHAIKFHDFFLFFKIESAFGRSFIPNKEHFSLFSHPATVNLIIDTIFTIVILAVLYFVFKKLSALYGFFMLATIFSALTSGTLMSIGRYSLVLFPMFILLAGIKNKNWQMTWAFVSVIFLALDIILWVNNYWAG